MPTRPAGTHVLELARNQKNEEEKGVRVRRRKPKKGSE